MTVPRLPLQRGNRVKILRIQFTPSFNSEATYLHVNKPVLGSLGPKWARPSAPSRLFRSQLDVRQVCLAASVDLSQVFNELCLSKVRSGR